MNERIKELAQQASTELCPIAKCYVGEAWYNKFAELVASECINIIESTTFNGYGLSVKEIKTRFGVK
jgi:hypothetical protein